MTVPWIVGQLFESAGPTTVFVVALVNLGVGMVIYGVFVLKRYKPSSPHSGLTGQIRESLCP